jgi:glycerophosphoryl diester phosphodiesterase
MRSSKSATDPLDPGPAGFAHRGLHGPGIPENSLAAFAAAIGAGAGIECDVRLSGDGQLVVFHDHDLRRLCASALTVEATAAAILLRQKLLDSDQHIPLLADLLRLVAGRVPILIELKCRGGNSVRIADAASTILAAYAGPAGVMSFEPNVGRWLRRHRPAVRRGLVISGRASAFDRWRGQMLAKPDFVAVDCSAVSLPWATKVRRHHWLYSWTIRSPELRETARVHADALIWEADGRP